jgi:holo-ACP synthase CitX
MNDPFADAVPVTLAQMLDARENRAARQRELLTKHPGVLVSFTLNLPGKYKRYSLADRGFEEGCDAIRLQLACKGALCLHEEKKYAMTGNEAFFHVDAQAGEVKKWMMDIEDSHALGRLFDIDVLSGDGTPLNGEDFGRAARYCLLCGKPVLSCARTRAHDAKTLATHAAGIFANFFNSSS